MRTFFIFTQPTLVSDLAQNILTCIIQEERFALSYLGKITVLYTDLKRVNLALFGIGRDFTVEEEGWW